MWRISNSHLLDGHCWLVALPPDQPANPEASLDLSLETTWAHLIGSRLSDTSVLRLEEENTSLYRLTHSDCLCFFLLPDCAHFSADNATTLESCDIKVESNLDCIENVRSVCMCTLFDHLLELELQCALCTIYIIPSLSSFGEEEKASHPFWTKTHWQAGMRSKNYEVSEKASSHKCQKCCRRWMVETERRISWSEAAAIVKPSIVPLPLWVVLKIGSLSCLCFSLISS